MKYKREMNLPQRFIISWLTKSYSLNPCLLVIGPIIIFILEIGLAILLDLANLVPFSYNL